MFFVETAADLNLPETGVHMLEAWRRWTFNIPTKELKDFPECGVPTPPKRCRPQSPCLLDEGPCLVEDDCKEPFTCGLASDKCIEQFDLTSVGSKCCIEKTSGRTNRITQRVVQLECSSLNTCFQGQGNCDGDDGCSGNLVCGDAIDQATDCTESNRKSGDRCCKCPEPPPTPDTEPTCTDGVCTTTVLLDYVDAQSNVKLNSRNYPKKYEAGTNETFVIKAKDGRSFIRILFLDFKVQCNNSNITITQGTGEDPTEICKDIIGGETVIESKQPTLTITFTTNGTEEERGFLFRASLIEGPKIEHTVLLNSTVIKKSFSSTKANTTDDSDDQVPTNNYTANSVETWNFKSKSSKGRIRIELIELFEVELSENCTKDHLNIIEAGSTEALMNNTCGCQLPPSVETSKDVNKVTVTFNSDYSVTRQGFKFNASVVSDKPETLRPENNTITLRRDRANTNLSRTFESQNYQAYKENIMEVFNIIAADKNNPIKIEFLEFELEDACELEDCLCDYVKITEYDDSELLGKRCGTPTNKTLLTRPSKSHNVTLTFVSDYAISGKGFRVKASLECPDKTSSTNIFKLTQEESSKEFSSSNFPDNYNLNSTEVFIIENGNQGNSMIKIEFIEFQTEENYDNITITQASCRGSFCSVTELLNMTSGSVSPLGRLDVESASSYVNVTFVSDCLETKKGFKFRAVLVDKVEPICRTQTDVTFEGDTYAELLKCQTVATIRQESRVFTSQNYPSNYDLNSVESFNMRAEDDSRKIKIEFLAFDLEQSTNCEKDYVNINEGEATVVQQEVTLGQEERLFFSSNYPKKYNNNSHESFIIKAKGDFKIKVQFIDFELESSDTGCAYDYVNITEGENVLQDNVCGCDNELTTNELTSTTSEIDVRLFSDYSVATRGFKFRASVDAQPVVQPVSTTTLSRKTRSTDVAEISSSGYESVQNYTVNVNETYVIKTDDGISWIKIKFLDFSVEPSSSKSNPTDCSSSKNRFDYVWITESDGTEILPKTCGEASIADILSKTQEVTVHFFSDYASAYRGFKLEATLVDADPKLSNQTIVIGSDSEAVEVKTKNFPCNYNSNERENFTINNTVGNWVKIEFLEFELQEATTSPLQTDACLNDYVIITQEDGTTETTLMYPVCGNKKPLPLESNSTQVTISFTSDYTETFKGLKFRATNVPKYTSEINLGDISRIVTSENYPHNYNSNTGKTIVINAKDDESSIKIEFLDFEVPSVPSDLSRHPIHCPEDYVTITEEDGTSETTLLDKSCGNNLPEPVESTEMSNMLSLKFVSDSDVTGRGFKFRATSVPKVRTTCESEEEDGCVDDDLIGYNDQRNYTTEIKLDQNGESRIFTSPNYPADYRSNTSQTVTFENPDNQNGSLRIEFIEFQVQDDPSLTVDCPCDFVNIIDEETGDEILPNTCGFELPNTIETFAARISLNFNTDESVSFKGFKVRVLFVEKSEVVETCEDERGTNAPTEGGTNREVTPPTCSDNPSEASASCFGSCVVTRVNNKTNTRREIKPKLENTCGTKDSSALPSISITSTSPLVSLNFFSDSDIQGRGFKFRASLEIKPPDNETTTIRLQTNNNMIEKDVDVEKVNTNHKYHLVGEGLTSRIKIEFQQFTMNNDSECRYDYVNIIQLDGVGDNVLLQKSCGEKLPPTIISTSPIVTLNFYSDYNVENDALKFKASLIVPPTPTPTPTPTEIHTEILRVDTFLKFNSTAMANSERNFIIRAGKKNKGIQIKFLEFNVNDVQDCLQKGHTVKITQLDGLGNNILLNKTCGSNIPVPENSTEPEVTLQFASISDISDDVVSSFKVYVSLIDTKCQLRNSDVKVSSIDSNGTRFNFTKTNCRGTINDLDCCTALEPCGLGEGDCDEDFHCQGELR